jgi:hypothetical protein
MDTPAGTQALQDLLEKVPLRTVEPTVKAGNQRSAIATMAMTPNHGNYTIQLGE